MKIEERIVKALDGGPLCTEDLLHKLGIEPGGGEIVPAIRSLMEQRIIKRHEIFIYEMEDVQETEIDLPTYMGLDATVPAGISPLCGAKHTGFDAHKVIMCEHEPTAWCSLRDIWVCRKCCQLCYEDLYPEGCMEAEDIWRTRLKPPTPL